MGTMTKTDVTPAVHLTLSDRCDRCKAQAFTLWQRDGGPLKFCGHHTNEHEPVLVATGWDMLVDDRAKLLLV